MCGTNQLLFADDFNRVVLKTISGEEHSDYINASYVDVSPINKANLLLNTEHTLQGYKRRQVYIGAQGTCMCHPLTTNTVHWLVG